MKDLDDLTDDELDSILNEFNVSTLIDNIDDELKIEKDPKRILELENKLKELLIIQKNLK
jgi:uncharacterized protein YpiB (UPF0302 family)